ncbi:MAG: GHKL domain-containing protein [Lachnospiraceae bacterium]|nr:GHKL domain-containing protein [Lachnospiraceae bacterium]
MTAGFYFRNFAGFLIQFGAGMLLCLLPFDEGAFRYPRRRVVILSCALALVTSALFPIVIGTDPVNNLAPLANLYMSAALLIFVFMYFRTLQVERVKKMTVLVLALLYAAAQYLLVNLFLAIFPGGLVSEIYPPLTLALYAGTAAVMCPFFALLLRRGVRQYLIEMESEKIRREFGVLLLVTFLYLIILVIYASSPAGLLPFFWRWIVPPLLLISAVLGIFYWTLFREAVRRKRDSEERKALEIQKLQYDRINSEMERTRRLRHDMHHSMNLLSELIAEGNLENAKDYLSELTVQIDHRETTIYCKNTTVNGLLQYYAGMATDRKIACRIHAECGEASISQVDLTVLIGNLMENAIHACEQWEKERWITVEIGLLSDSMLIQVVNPCREIYPSGKYRPGGSFLPAEAFLSGRDGGGCGLHSLEHTAEKYGGNARFQFDEQEQTFTARIRLNLEAQKS